VYANSNVVHVYEQGLFPGVPDQIMLCKLPLVLFMHLCHRNGSGSWVHWLFSRLHLLPSRFLPIDMVFI